MRRERGNDARNGTLAEHGNGGSRQYLIVKACVVCKVDKAAVVNMRNDKAYLVCMSIKHYLGRTGDAARFERNEVACAVTVHLVCKRRHKPVKSGEQILPA